MADFDTSWTLSFLVCPAKTQTSLDIHPVWSVFAVHMKMRGSLATHKAHSSDNSDQTGQTPRLTWIFALDIGYFVGFVMCRLI